jgi:hypothetical protein
MVIYIIIFISYLFYNFFNFTNDISSTGRCLPYGLLDVTDCYYGFPIALSYPHFKNSHPDLITNITGSSPNASHDSYFLINPVSILVFRKNIKCCQSAN